MKVTIKDIAELSGVGIATVSRVINNSGYVSDKTRQKVLDVIKKYNYKSNSINSRLSSGVTTVGVFVKGIGNPFFQKMTRELEREFNLRGCTVIFYDVLHVNEIQVASDEVKTGRLDGVIIMGGNNAYTEEEIRNIECPVVLLTVNAQDRVPKEIYSSVSIDDELEGYNATKALIDLGHKNIGFIYVDVTAKDTPNFRRFMGYRRALEEHGIEYNADYVAGADSVSSSFATEVNGYRLGFSMMQKLLRTNLDITAVFSYADILAMGAAKCALVSGRNIPNTMSIIGFDGIDEAEFYHPSIDTMSQPTAAMVNTAASLLFDLLDGRGGKQEVLSCNLLRRGSTRAI